MRTAAAAARTGGRGGEAGAGRLAPLEFVPAARQGGGRCEDLPLLPPVRKRRERRCYEGDAEPPEHPRTSVSVIRPCPLLAHPARDAPRVTPASTAWGVRGQAVRETRPRRRRALRVAPSTDFGASQKQGGGGRGAGSAEPSGWETKPLGLVSAKHCHSFRR